MSFYFRKILRSGKHIRKLSSTDIIELTNFIEN